MKKFFLWLSLTVGFFAGITASDARIVKRRQSVHVNAPGLSMQLQLFFDDATIRTLKEDVEMELDIPIENQQAIINGKEWPDGTILANTGLEDGGVVTIREKPEGESDEDDEPDYLAGHDEFDTRPAEPAERPLNDQLFNAITYDDADRIKQLIDQGANPNMPYGDETILAYAVREGKANAVEALIAKGANPHIKVDNVSMLDLPIAKVQFLRGEELKAHEKIIELLRAKGVSETSETPRFTQHQKVGLTLAALTAAVGSFIKFRLYQNTKKRLAKKYKLGNLTPLQDKVWLATVLASYRIPWRLRALVRNNPGSLESLVGKDPQALAELYYGHAPSKTELDAFIERFFADIVGK